MMKQYIITSDKLKRPHLQLCIVGPLFVIQTRINYTALCRQPEWSTLIGREGRDRALIGRELYGNEIGIFMMLLRQLSYAIKNQLLASKCKCSAPLFRQPQRRRWRVRGKRQRKEYPDQVDSGKLTLI